MQYYALYANIPLVCIILESVVFQYLAAFHRPKGNVVVLQPEVPPSKKLPKPLGLGNTKVTECRP